LVARKRVSGDALAVSWVFTAARNKHHLCKGKVFDFSSREKYFNAIAVEKEDFDTS
jgi:hypothetical protein